MLVAVVVKERLVLVPLPFRLSTSQHDLSLTYVKTQHRHQQGPLLHHGIMLFRYVSRLQRKFVLFWWALIPKYRLLVMSILSLKAKPEWMYSLVHFLAYIQWILIFISQCDTCQPLLELESEHYVLLTLINMRKGKKRKGPTEKLLTKTVVPLRCSYTLNRKTQKHQWVF